LPFDLLGYSNEQYGDNCAIMDSNSFYSIPKKYAGENIPWVKGLSLQSGREILVPADFCFPFPDRITAKNSVAFCNSEGLAAGTDYCDAFLQAVLEIIEKDAVGIWWANQISCPVVDPGTTLIRPGLLDIFHSLGLRFTIFNLSLDFPVPVYAVVSYTDELVQYITFGCHLSAEIALERAITEHHQAILLRGKPKNFDLRNFQFLSGDSSDWLPGNEFALRNFDHFKDVNQYVVELFTARKLELVVVDASPLNTPVRIIRVCVPGIVSGLGRLGSKRLNSVPKKIGLRLHDFGFKDFLHKRIEVS
jgi:ribosomal protein S12 methylthiotransferase accessory factor